MKRKQNAEVETGNEQQPQERSDLEPQQSQNELIETPTENGQMQFDENINKAETSDSTT